MAALLAMAEEYQLRESDLSPELKLREGYLARKEPVVYNVVSWVWYKCDHQRFLLRVVIGTIIVLLIFLAIQISCVHTKSKMISERYLLERRKDDSDRTDTV